MRHCQIAWRALAERVTPRLNRGALSEGDYGDRTGNAAPDYAEKRVISIWKSGHRDHQQNSGDNPDSIRYRFHGHSAPGGSRSRFSSKLSVPTENQLSRRFTDPNSPLIGTLRPPMRDWADVGNVPRDDLRRVASVKPSEPASKEPSRRSKTRSN